MKTDERIYSVNKW